MKRLSFLKKRRLFIAIALAIILIVGFLLFNYVSAYDSNNAHRALTYEAGEFFNLNYDSKLSSQELEWLMQGAQGEDTPPRWINHFYNPQTGEGWNADKLGSISPDIVSVLSSFALSSRKPISAKNWAKNISAQSDYDLYEGNQTWQKAIDSYISGDKKSAYIALGHILHLLEDMTVPDHTRGDTHAGLLGDKGSPYENWAKNYNSGKVGKLTVAEELSKSGVRPKDFPIIDNYFDWNSKYSSENFFSEDTITEGLEISVTSKINIGSDEMIFVKVGSDVYAVAKHPQNDNNINNYTIDDPQILLAYWQRLSKQAVISGAGAINLFFKDAEAAKKLNQNSVQDFDYRPARSVVFSPFGELAKLNKAIAGIFSGTRQLAANLFPQTAQTEVVSKVKDDGAENSSSPSQNSDEGNTQNNNSPKANQNNSSASGDDSQPSAAKNSSPSVQDDKKETVQNSDKEKSSQNNSDGDEQLYVSRVIDGDTLTLSNGLDVRLIGIDTPEYGDACYDEAKKELERLVLGKYVTMEKDQSEIDKYSRLLRYLYLDTTQINAELVKNGFAKILSIPPDTKYSTIFRMLEEEAKAAERGCLYFKEKKQVIDDRGPYYGGASYAGGEMISSYAVPVPKLESDLSASSTADDASATSTPELPITPTSTPESATSTPVTLPDTSATSTPESATSTPESEIPSSEKILISEIQVAGQTSDDEFVELYNPNNNAVLLKGWSIQYRGSSSQKFYKKNFEGNAEIPAYGFYLIGYKNYSASSSPDMTHSTFSLSSDGGTVFLVRGKSTIETGTETEISDKVSYHNGMMTTSTQIFPETKEIDITNLAIGGSIERKSSSSSTSETMEKGGINETDGNAYDMDNNYDDFVLRTISDPQNSSSTPEDPTNQNYPASPEPEPEPELPSESDPTTVCIALIYENHKNYEGSINREIVQDFPYPILKDTTVTLSKDTTYYVDDVEGAYVPAGAKLVIEEGAVIKFGKWRRINSIYFPIMLRVMGSLEINGTKDNPVIFTTFRDDEHGLSIETSTSTPSPGDWGALQIESGKNETIKISGANFYYGGGSADGGNAQNGAIFINLSSAEIEISDSAVYKSFSGIYSRQIFGQPQILNNIFEYNSIWGIAMAKDEEVKIIGNTFSCNGLSRASGTTGGISLEGKIDNVIVENNNFLGNQNVGLSYYTDKKTELNAANNYWGASSGPYHATKNPEGLGDAVSDNIIFSPWSSSIYGLSGDVK